MKLTEEQAADLIWEQSADPDLHVEDIGDWVNVGKGEHIWVIFYSQDEGENFYRLETVRYGSEFTDWHYEHTLSCKQVQKREIKSFIWEDTKMGK